MAYQMESEEFICPTFTSYSKDNSAQTAARVAATSSYLEDADLDFEFHLGHIHVALDTVASPPSDSPPSDSDESEGADTCNYCAWVPRKSKSTGSSWKRWNGKLFDLLRSSNSEGKGDYIFLSPKMFENVEVKKEHKMVKSKVKILPVEEFYVNRATREGQKRKSYLPYRKNLLGFFH